MKIRLWNSCFIGKSEIILSDKILKIVKNKLLELLDRDFTNS